MKQEIRNNGIEDITVLIADEGKDLYCNFHESNMGKEVWLGYTYYDKNGNVLETPHKHTPEDFIEIDEVKLENDLS